MQKKLYITPQCSFVEFDESLMDDAFAGGSDIRAGGDWAKKAVDVHFDAEDIFFDDSRADEDDANDAFNPDNVPSW